MLMQTVATKADLLTSWRAGLWRLRLPRPVLAGITDRSADLDTLQAQLAHTHGTLDERPTFHGLVLAQQIHGASLAVIDSPQPSINPIPGCDGLITAIRGLPLIIRTADCLPLFLWDPIQQVVGLAHVGWRGLVSRLPMRLISVVRHYYHSRPGDLWVGIGPAIRSCCYEVGQEVEQLLSPFVQEREGRRTCDLVACASAQLAACGVLPSHLLDTGQCTACHPTRWYSVRRDGETGGRLLSFIMISQ